MTTSELQVHFSRGYDSGNYANAYESEYLAVVMPASLAEYCKAEGSLEKPAIDAWSTGFILGFYSSYEWHEIPDVFVGSAVRAYRTALSAGWPTGREEDDESEVPDVSI